MPEDDQSTPCTLGGFEVGPASGEIVIGDGPSKGDTQEQAVEIPIVNGTDCEQRIRVLVSVAYGVGEACLLNAKGDPVEVELAAKDGPEPSNYKLSWVEGEPGKSELCWQSASLPRSAPTLDQTETVTIRLSGITSKTPPGDGEVTITIHVHDGEKWVPAETNGEETGPKKATVKVRKVAPEGEEPTIDYFTVSPDFQMHAGGKVTVSFHGRNYDTYTLKRNNEWVKSWEQGDAEKTFPDNPSITTVYELRAKKNLAGPEGSPDIRHCTVQVIASGWNQLRLPQGYPSQLFVHTDFRGATTGNERRLYGIFVGDEGAKLYSSQNGIDDWRDEQAAWPTDMPPDMAHSPGVAFDDRLWLIGGSSFDENKQSKQVWCYERKDPNDATARERKWVRKKDLPRELACHACFVQPGDTPKIVVTGGVSGTEHMAKSCTLLTHDAEWAEGSGNGIPDLDAGRRMHSAIAFKPFDDEPWQTWLYGGLNAEGKKAAPDQLLATACRRDEKDGAWNKQDRMQPHQGYPLASVLVASPSFEEVRAENPGGDGTGNAAQTRVPAAPMPHFAPDGSGLPTRHRLFLLGTFVQPDPTGQSTSAPPDTLPVAPPWEGEPGPNVTVSRLFEWHPVNRRWELREVGRGWETFGGTWFRMQAISFGGRLYVWSLHAQIDKFGKPSLNVLVP